MALSLSGGGGGLEINFQFSSEPIIKVHRSTEVFYYENAVAYHHGELLAEAFTLFTLRRSFL